MMKSWSFTRYSDFKRCPRYAKLKHVERLSEPKAPALERGSAIHDAIAQYIAGKTATLGAYTKDVCPQAGVELRSIRKLKAKDVEQKLAFDKSWSLIDWDSPKAWLRFSLDVGRLVKPNAYEITDWKTGKFRAYEAQEYTEQLSLYALCAMTLHPDVSEVRARLYYVDLGVQFPADGWKVWLKSDAPKLKELWTQRARDLEMERLYAPRVNAKCRWCWFGQARKAEGGPGLCEY